jgi:GH15 family glucan-1,4-alpha-glucosidase
VWELASDLVEAAISRWREPDHGIWEVRAGPFHFVYSKLMCWVALDRGIALAEKVRETGVLRRWRAVRQEIRRDILDHGWHPGRQAFVQHYGSTALDASNLLLPLVGFLPPTDPRLVATVERTMEELCTDNLVHRYRTQETEDGLTGSEGAFTLCTFWLVQNLARMGRVEEAQGLFESTLRYANDLGLFSEMVDPRTGELLGNFPQAFTHIGLVLAAQDLWRARTGKITRAAR